MGGKKADNDKVMWPKKNKEKVMWHRGRGAGRREGVSFWTSLAFELPRRHCGVHFLLRHRSDSPDLLP